MSTLGGRKFILRPSPAVVDFSVLCLAEGIKNLPADLDFVEVRGRRKIPLRRMDVLRNNDAMIVEEIRPAQLSRERIKPNLSFSDAQDVLVQNYVDTPDEVKTSLLLSVISSPMDRWRVGGLTDTIMPTNEEYAPSVRNLLSDVGSIIPPDLTSNRLYPVGARGIGKIYIVPFSWNYQSASSNELSTLNVERELFARRLSNRYQNELSIGISSNQPVPRSLKDVWISRADLRVLADNRIQRYHDVENKHDLEFAKYLITMHMTFPSCSNEIQSGLDRFVKSKLSKLKHDFDADGFGGLIDPDVVFGTPRTIFHLAGALARAGGSGKLTSVHLHEAVDHFDEMHRSLFKAWEDKGIRFGNERLDAKLAKMSVTAEKIYAYIVEHSDSAKSEIREAFPKLTDLSFMNEFDMIHSAGLIYKSSDFDDRYSAVY